VSHPRDRSHSMGAISTVPTGDALR